MEKSITVMSCRSISSKSRSEDTLLTVDAICGQDNVFVVNVLRTTPFISIENGRPRNAIAKMRFSFLISYTSFLPHSNKKTTSVEDNRIYLPEPHYLIFTNQLGNEVIFGGCHIFATEVVLSRNEVEMRFLSLNYFENVFSKQK